MIFEEFTNSNPMLLCGMAIKAEGNNISVPTQQYSPDFCYCQYECEECIDVWGNGILDWQNDKSTFAFVKTIDTDTFSLKILKDGVQVAIISDNTFGDYTPTYTQNPKQYSFVLDWNLVFQAFGAGTYQVKNDYTVLGVANEFLSSKYCLSDFNDIDADGWIKFDWFQEGNIQKSPFNFCEPLFFSLKYKGIMTEETPETIKDSYQTSEREVKQFRNEIKSKYLIKSKLIDKSLLYQIKDNMLHAEKISVTDFNLFGTNEREKELSFVEVANLSDKVGNRKYTIDISFEDYIQNNIKDNCC